MNRFIISKGRLSDASGNDSARSISPTDTSINVDYADDGYQLYYNLAGQRLQAIREGYTEQYTYTADNRLQNVYINDVLRAERLYDNLGNMTVYKEYNADGTTLPYRAYTYNKDHQVIEEKTGQQFLVAKTITNLYNAAGIQSETNVLKSFTGTNVRTIYTYAAWDSYKQQKIEVQPINSSVRNWASGFSNYIYNENGHVTEVRDEVGNKSTQYLSNQAGMVLKRGSYNGTTLSGQQYYYYLNNRTIGDVGDAGPSPRDYVEALAKKGSTTASTATGSAADSVASGPVTSADFDQSLQNISPNYPTKAPGNYTVQTGDTLTGIALQLWGDSSFWFLLAEANGLLSDSDLFTGQNLNVPNVVANSSNNTGTIQPYDAGAVIGDTNPTIPDAPPPPRKRCGALRKILSIVIAIANNLKNLSPEQVSAFMSGFDSGDNFNQILNFLGITNKTYQQWKDQGNYYRVPLNGGGGYRIPKTKASLIGIALRKAELNITIQKETFEYFSLKKSHQQIGDDTRIFIELAQRALINRAQDVADRGINIPGGPTIQAFTTKGAFAYLYQLNNKLADYGYITGTEALLQKLQINNIQKGLALSAGLDLGLGIAGRPIASGVKGVGKFLADPKRLGLTLIVGGETSTLLSGGGAANAATDSYTIKVAKVIRNLLARGYSQKQISLSLQSANSRLAITSLRESDKVFQNISLNNRSVKIDKKIMFEPNPNTANGLPIWEVKLVNGKEVKQSTFGKLEIGGKILYIKSAEGYPSLMLKNNPRIPTNARSYTHVEGRAASIMRQSGIKSAKLTINNTNGVCDPCRGNMEKSLLPDGGKLNVRYPDGQGGYTQRILIKR